MNGINVLTIGGGMYVSGRGTAGFGTVLPTLAQKQHDGDVERLLFAVRSAASGDALRDKAHALRAVLGFEPELTTFPEQGEDALAYERALDALPQPGAVIVCTPDPLHTPMALAAIERGFHVLVVKPLAPTLAEATRLADAAAGAGVYGAVEFHKRFDPANLKLKEALDLGRLGTLEYVHVEYSQRVTVSTEIFRDWVESSNVFLYLGVHYADVIQWATGATPLRTAALGQRVTLAARGLRGYDAIQSLTEWELPNGDRFASTMLLNWIDPETTSAMSYQLVKLWGSDGRLESDQRLRGHQEVTTAGIEDVNPLFCQTFPDADSGFRRFRGYGPESIATFLRDAADVATGASAPADFEGRRPTFRDALRSVALADAVAASVEAGGAWTPVAPIPSPHGGQG